MRFWHWGKKSCCTCSFLRDAWGKRDQHFLLKVKMLEENYAAPAFLWIHYGSGYCTFFPCSNVLGWRKENAGGGSWTLTSVTSTVFETAAYAIPPLQQIIFLLPGYFKFGGRFSWHHSGSNKRSRRRGTWWKSSFWTPTVRLFQKHRWAGWCSPGSVACSGWSPMRNRSKGCRRSFWIWGCRCRSRPTSCP